MNAVKCDSSWRARGDSLPGGRGGRGSGLTWLAVRVVRPGAVVAGGGHAGEGRLVGLVAHHSDDAPVRHHRARLGLVGEAAVLHGGHDARGCGGGVEAVRDTAGWAAFSST